jgi:flagellar basal-body rod protein FlgB
MNGLRPGMESHWSKEGPPPLSSGDPVPVLFDTTQLALERAISGASTRQEALAANIANADTPGYQRVDVDFHGALAAAMGSSDRRSALERTGFTPAVDKSVGAMRADGSTVDMDAEQAKLAANALDQQAAVQVAASRIQILKFAIGGAS